MSTQDLRATIEAARWQAIEAMPYLASAIAACPVVIVPPSSMPGATMASDRYWRVYVRADILDQGEGVPEIAHGWLHEVAGHLIRDHAGRSDRAYADRNQANIAGDCEIESWTLPSGIRRPEGIVTPELMGVPAGLLMEDYLRLLADQYQAGQQGQQSVVQSSQQQQGKQSGQHEGGYSGQGQGQDQGDGAGGDGSESPDAHNDGASNGGNGQGQEDGADGDGSESPDAHNDSASNGGNGQGHPRHRDCGSCCGGPARPYEAQADAAGVPRLDGAQADAVRQVAAQAIVEHAAQYGHGSVPAGLLIWAEAKVRPAPPCWRAAIRRWAARHGLAIAGATAQVGPYRERHGVLVPRWRCQRPHLLIVADTSGSMSALGGEVLGAVVSACSAAEVDVAWCDTKTTVQRRVTARTLKPVGGGGTDLSRAIDAAGGWRRYDAVAVVTDGKMSASGWPTEPPINTAVLMLGAGRSTPWQKAKVIEVRP